MPASAVSSFSYRTSPLRPPAISRFEDYAKVKLQASNGKFYNVCVKGNNRLLADDQQLISIAYQMLGLNQIYTGKKIELRKTADQTTVEQLDLQPGETSPRILYKGRHEELDRKISQQSKQALPEYKQTLSAPPSVLTVPPKTALPLSPPPPPPTLLPLAVIAAPSPVIRPGVSPLRGDLLGDIKKGTALKSTQFIAKPEPDATDLSSSKFKEQIVSGSSRLKKVAQELIKDASCGVLDPNRKKESENPMAGALALRRQGLEVEDEDDDDDDDDYDDTI